MSDTVTPSPKLPVANIHRAMANRDTPGHTDALLQAQSITWRTMNDREVLRLTSAGAFEVPPDVSLDVASRAFVSSAAAKWEQTHGSLATSKLRDALMMCLHALPPTHPYDDELPCACDFCLARRMAVAALKDTDPDL